MKCIIKKDKIGFFEKLRISIFNINRYNELLKLRFSHAIVYSLVLSLITGSILGGMTINFMNKVEHSVRGMVLSEDFKFEMNNGILDFKNSPIKKDYGKFLILLDTNISLDEVDNVKNILVHKDSSLALLKDGVYLNIGGQKFEYNYGNNLERIDNEVILNSLGAMNIFKVIMFLAALLGTTLQLIFNSLILSILGLILNQITNKKMRYSNILKLSIYSMTLPVLISIVYPIGILGIVIASVYYLIFMSKFKIEDSNLYI